MTVAVLTGIPWSVPWLVAAGAALGGRPAPVPEAGPGLRRRAARRRADEGLLVLAAPALSLIAVAAALLATAAGAATSPDLLFFWGPKAQQFALARSFDAAFMRDELHHHMHAYYPPLVTNLGAFSSMAVGRMSWTGATLTFPLLLAALAVGLPGALGSRLGRARAAAMASLTVAAIAYLGVEADVAGNAEMTLLLFETLAMALLLFRERRERADAASRRDPSRGGRGGQGRGLPFVVSAAALFFLARPEASRPFWPAAARLLLPSAAMLSAWFAFGASRADLLRLFRLRALPGSARRSLSARPLGRGPVPVRHRPRPPWLVPLACVLLALPLSRRWILPIGTAAILTAFFLFTYIHRAEDPSLWISWSAPRIFSPLADAPGARGEPRGRARAAPRAPMTRSRIAWLAGAAVLVLFPLWRFFERPLREQLRLPLTPVDRVDGARARQWLFLEESRPHVPPKSSFTVLADAPDVEMALYMMSFGILQDGLPLPTRYYGNSRTPNSRTDDRRSGVSLIAPARSGARSK